MLRFEVSSQKTNLGHRPGKSGQQMETEWTVRIQVRTGRGGQGRESSMPGGEIDSREEWILSPVLHE